MVQKFYHVHIQREGPPYHRWTYETNLSKKQVLDSFVLPFNAKSEIICNGLVFKPSEIGVFRIYQTANKVRETHQFQDFEVDKEVTQGKEVTRQFVEEGKKFEPYTRVSVNSNQVFIVHGHDSEAKLELARTIDKDFGLEAVILHEQPNNGNTLIEKLERVSEVMFLSF